MAMSITLQEQSQNIIVVIRTAGERTLEACKAFVLKQIPMESVWVVDERPFEAALRKSYEIGIESSADWLMTVDADIFLREGAVSEVLSATDGLPEHFFQFEGHVYDKLTGMYRKAGHRMYRTKYLKTALQQIPAENTEIRPEYMTLQRMEAMGFPSMEIETVFGVHDYEQFYRDIYRKAFVHANKHQIWLPQLISRWKALSSIDGDFRIALRGLYDGLIGLTDVKLDPRNYVAEAEHAVADLGFQEKRALPANDINFNKIEAILTDAGMPPKNQKSKSLEARLERLESRYAQLGALRLAPYLFGSILCDLGAGIKRLVEKKR
jgi:hypothetical protein